MTAAAFIAADERAALAGVGAIDCDAHLAAPDMAALLPFLDDHWRCAFAERGVPGFHPVAYPPRSPLTVSPLIRTASAAASGGVDYLRDVAAPLGVEFAIVISLCGAHLPMSEDMAAGLASAVNDWTRAAVLDADPRLRAAIVVAPQDPDRAADEIERCAADRRFVQVLLPMTTDAPLGKRRYWPIYAAAARHGLPVAVHAGGADRSAPTAVGWPSHHVEDVAAWSTAFQGQLASLICEGAFTRHPDLRVVLIESGVTWLAPFLWRLSKFWRGCRSEVPWLDRPPEEIARDHVSLTLTPFDAPADGALVAQLIEEIGSEDMLLWASDYPHGGRGEALGALGADTLRRAAVDNPRRLYARLGEETA